VYDPAEDSWTAIASMMVPRCEFGLCAVDGRLYAFGGWVGEDIGQPVDPDPDPIGAVNPGPGRQK
jgi:actin-binding protein IPP